MVEELQTTKMLDLLKQFSKPILDRIVLEMEKSSHNQVTMFQFQLEIFNHI
jgi:hypothetical protein